MSKLQGSYLDVRQSWWEFLIRLGFGLLQCEKLERQVRKSKSSTSALKGNILERQVGQTQCSLLLVKEIKSLLDNLVHLRWVQLIQLSQYMLFLLLRTETKHTEHG